MGYDQSVRVQQTTGWESGITSKQNGRELAASRSEPAQPALASVALSEPLVRWIESANRSTVFILLTHLPARRLAENGFGDRLQAKLVGLNTLSKRPNQREVNCFFVTHKKHRGYGSIGNMNQRGAALRDRQSLSLHVELRHAVAIAVHGTRQAEGIGGEDAGQVRARVYAG